MNNTTVQLIGPAALIVRAVLAAPPDRLKLLLFGGPGVGKTTAAEQIAETLCGGKFAVESANGRNVTIHVVREWAADMSSSCLFGTGWKAKIVNEVDTMPRDAQDALLTLLDEMPRERAFIATSNLELTALTERFWTRLLRREVKAPSAIEIEAHLRQLVPASIASHLASLAAGNVRAACLDAEAWTRENKPSDRIMAQFETLFSFT